MMRNVFVFIAFCVLMLLTAASVAHTGGTVTSDEQCGVAIVCFDFDLDDVAVSSDIAVLPGVSECIAGFSVNRFCSISDPFSFRYEYDVNHDKFMRRGVALNTRRTWTRVIWTTSDFT